MTTRLLARRFIKPLLTLAVALALAVPAFGQSTWQGTSANWSTGFDSQPTSSGTTVLDFLGDAFTATTNNIGPLTINQLNMDGTNTGFSVSGPALTFGGTTPMIRTGITTNTTGGPIGGTLTINSPLVFSVTTTLSPQVNYTNGIDVQFNGGLSGSGNLLMGDGSATGTNVLIASSNNTGLTGTMTVASVNIHLAAFNALPRTMFITCGSGSSTFITGTVGTNEPDAGYNQQMFRWSGSGFQVGTTSSPSTTLLGFDNLNAMTFSANGAISAANVSSSLAKVGTNTINVQFLQGNYQGGFQVRDGKARFGAAAGAFRGAAGQGDTALYNAGIIDLDSSGAAATNNNNNDRLSTTTTVRLAGGVMRMEGSQIAATATNEVVGPMDLRGGNTTIALNPNTGGVLSLTFSNGAGGVIPLRGGMATIVGTSLGGAAAASVSQLKISNLSGVGATTPIVPWALSQTAYTTNLATGTAISTAVDTFLAVGGANGVAPLTVFDASNVKLSSITAVSSGTINSLITAAGGQAGLTGTVTLTSGAFLSTTPGGPSVTGAGALATAGTMYMSATGTTTTDPGVNVNAANLSKGGAGSLSILGTVNLGASPLVAVNAGSLTMNLATATGGTSVTYQVSKGASLTLAGGILGSTLTGNGTYTGNLEVPVNSVLIPSGMGGKRSDGASAGTLTVSGTLRMDSGSKLVSYLNSIQDGQYNTGNVNATAIDTTFATPGSITVNAFSLDLKEENNANMYDFNKDTTTNYVWKIMTGNVLEGAAAAAKFTAVVNSGTGFTNTFTPNGPGNTFFITSDATGVYLNFGTAVPEPVLLGLASFGLLALVRRRVA